MNVVIKLTREVQYSKLEESVDLNGFFLSSLSSLLATVYKKER